MSGTCDAVGMPTVRLAYSSAKKRRHILDTHWLELFMLIVILASGHGSGSVERQCSSSDVNSGATTGRSLSLGWYLLVSVVVVPLLRCAWIFAASYTDWSWGPCWLTMALRYLQARMAALQMPMGTEEFRSKLKLDRR